RLQLQYRGVPKLVATVGRQRINLEDQRFVGSVGWRQNEQTFDAVRLEYGDAKGIKLDLTYAGSVRTIWGVDGKGARQQAVRGDNIFAFVSHPTPIGMLTGFAVFVDQEEPIVSLYRQSSKTVGGRLAGSRPVAKGAKLTYALSYARQSDHARNPNNFQSDYVLTEFGLDVGAAKFGLGREVLGADKGVPFTSFQTPLATLHKFQGWADKFLTTPPNGIKDIYGSAGYGWKKVGGMDAINALLVYHRFDSDRLDLHYGNEWNASLAAKKGKWTVMAKLADYQAKRFATDTRKAWLQLEWAY
ncbi:MAG: alginate export family protein, partial [Sphingomicrobium sp.]